MNIKRRLAALLILTSMLCGFTFGQGQKAVAAEKEGAAVRINPALADIDSLYVDIVASYSDFSTDAQFLGRLRAEAEQRIIGAGVNIYSGPVLVNREPENIPVLRVNIETFELGEIEQNMYRIQTSLLVGIYPAQAPSVLFKVDVWSRVATVGASLADKRPAAVADLVIKQVEDFVADYRAANSESSKAATAVEKKTIVAPVRRERVRQAPKEEASEDYFIASKNSRVFHKPGCSSAKRILEKNKVIYKSREEAINSGKRPCKRCKP